MRSGPDYVWHVEQPSFEKDNQYSRQYRACKTTIIVWQEDDDDEAGAQYTPESWRRETYRG
ncbi:hypothetical protein N7536_005443 [Penicillium majusculum]|nr:hypothetical protein N7536_005443 [Penicillium majusculum]